MKQARAILADTTRLIPHPYPDGLAETWISSLAPRYEKREGVSFAITLKEGECMGACGDAPVLLVDNKRMCSFMSHDKLDALMTELQSAAGATP